MGEITNLPTGDLPWLSAQEEPRRIAIVPQPLPKRPMGVHRSLAIVPCLLFAVAASANGQVKQIPPIHAIAVSGEHVDLPSGLHGRVAVLVVSFSQGSRDEVTAWGRRLEADYHGSPNVLYYEMPVLAGVPRPLRGWVTRKIKDSIPAPAQPRFVPILDHEAEWKAAAEFGRNGGEEDAYVLVVDSSGNILSRMAGAPSDQSYAELTKRLR